MPTNNSPTESGPLAGWTIKMAKDPNNWDFSVLPADQLVACLIYELSRHSESTRSLVTSGRAAFGLNTFDEHSKFYETRLMDAAKHSLQYTFAWHPEWPLAPYLSIPPGERRRRLHYRLREASNNRLQHFEARFNLAGGLMYKIKDGTLLPYLDIKSGYFRFKDVPPDLAHQWMVPDPESNVMLVVPYDLRLPITNLLDRIRELAIRVQARFGIAPEPATGAGSEPRTARARLKALGAWRLLAFMNWEQASVLTATASLQDKPLFATQSKWIAAKKRGEALVQR
ncbi:MAG: hypothetical protein AB7O66_19180 [Limisphaerales bacterium]